MSSETTLLPRGSAYCLTSTFIDRAVAADVSLQDIMDTLVLDDWVSGKLLFF